MFQRLSETKPKYAGFTQASRVDEAKKAIAAALGEVIYNVDVIDNGCIVSGDREVKYLEQPLQVVVHNANRQLPEWRQTSQEDAMNPWEDEPRCLLSCNHALTPDNLYGYCWNELSEQRTSFRCFVDVDGQRCGWEWFFPEVADNACLSADEHILFESRINRNWVNLSAGVRECPFCRSSCERQQPDNPRVLCVYCKREGKPNFEFCWYCFYPWSDDHSCSKDSARQILTTCVRKEIVKVPECPSIRACPSCRILIEHTEACKHMTCKNCKKSFCFICLDVQGQNGGYRCGSYNTKCAVAPVQNLT